jgi:hypothetical protein
MDAEEENQNLRDKKATVQIRLIGNCVLSALCVAAVVAGYVIAQLFL